MEIVRIYFGRLHAHTGRTGLWKRLSIPPTAVWLAGEALKCGVMYAIATIGAAGFVRGARRVEGYAIEIVPERLPSCLELVGDLTNIERFLRRNACVLQDASIIRFSGDVLDLESQALPRPGPSSLNTEVGATDRT